MLYPIFYDYIRNSDLKNNNNFTYIGSLQLASEGSITIPGLSKYKWLIIVPYGGQPSAPAIIVGTDIRFSGIATDGNSATIYEVGFSISGDIMTFSYNKAYIVPSFVEYKMQFLDIYGMR